MTILSQTDVEAQPARVGKIPGSGTIHRARWNGSRFVVVCGVPGAAIWTAGGELVTCGRCLRARNLTAVAS